MFELTKFYGAIE